MKTTIIWQAKGGPYFLCRVLNVGRSKDEIKVVATDSDSRAGALYMEEQERFTGSEIVRLHAEVSYHNDGTVLLKMPTYSDRTTTEYRNPAGTGVRRVALPDIRDWEPFARYTVVRGFRYTRKIEPVVVVADIPGRISCAPFQCTFWLGPSTAKEPPADAAAADTRLRNIGHNLDMLLRFEPSNYRGHVAHLPNTGRPILMSTNILQVVQYQWQVQPN